MTVRRHRYVIATMATAAMLLGLGAAAPQAEAGVSGRVRAAGTSEVAAAATSGSAAVSPFVTLLTGDRVAVGSIGGHPSYAVLPAQRSGPGSAIRQARVGGDTYVIPQVAEAYLGSRLDPSLFDVTRLASAAGGLSGRLDVAIAHTGARPALPGVTVTADTGGVADGYLTAASAPAFGAALVRQWEADQTAGAPSTAGLFAGVTKISAISAAPPVATPNFVMHTLIIKGIDASGAAKATMFGALMNVDDARKYFGFVEIVNGEARVSVPAGHYSGIFDLFTFHGGVAADRIVPISTYDVTGDGQTLTVDARTATVQPQITTPKPTDPASRMPTFTYAREAAGVGGMVNAYSSDSTVEQLVSPTPAVSVGTQLVQSSETATGGAGASAYTYDLAFNHASVPMHLLDRATPSTLATVHSALDTDQAGRVGGFGRGALIDGGYGLGLAPFTLPTVLNGYVGGSRGLTWGEAELNNGDSEVDPEFIDGGPYAYPAGSSVTHSWHQGPLGAGIPTPTAAAGGLATCYACQSSAALTVALAPFTDAMADHTGELFGNPDGTPVANFQLYRNGVSIFDQPDYLGTTMAVPAGSASYRGVLDVDRTDTGSLVSTRSHTEVGFTTAAGQGPLAPKQWYCDADQDGTTPCRVVPVLQAKAILPMSGLNSIPAGSIPVEVQAGRAPGAAAAAVTSATLGFRRTGSTAWSSVPLTAAGGGLYRGTLPVPASWQGGTGDLRLTATDAAGSTFLQTVTAAFAVAPAAASSAAAAAAARGQAQALAAAKSVGAEHRSCAAPAPGHAACLSIWRAGAGTVPAGSRTAAAPAVAPPAAGYGPATIASAYQLDQTKGSGQTIAIVDAFDDPNVESDLAASRAAWGLAPCTTANGCFRKVNQRGGTKPPAGDASWGVETSLDVQAVSYACPNCRILLVEGDDDSLLSLGLAEDEAVKLGADVVSNSYGTDEFTSMGALFKHYTHPGTAIVAATGDFGFTAASFPAVMRSTIAVGGTSLTPAAGGGWAERAWSEAGSGCSAYVGKPSWQKDKHCSMRTTADVSADADLATGLAVYDTYGLGADNGWIVVGGTSAATPLISGMIGLAGNASALSNASYLYAHRSGLHDVVGGSNGFCGGDYLCTAVKGYDGPTGLGSPRGTSAL